MPMKNIFLRTEEICDEDTVTAHPNNGNAKFTQNYTLRFHNQLDPKVTATLTFYDFGDPKEEGYELGNFCKNHPSATSFDILPNSHFDCEPDSPGDFKYKVTADPQKELDPIIIIKPSFVWEAKGPGGPGEDQYGAEGMGGIGAAALLSVVIPPVIGVIGGIFLANRFALKFKG